MESMGLPCAHLIHNWQLEQSSIYLHDVHLHWHFLWPNPDTLASVQLGSLLLYEPAIAKPKGRPPGSKNKTPASSTQRDPSAFELPTRRKQRHRGAQAQLKDS